MNFHGVEVSVPSAWPVDALQCGVPTRDTVVFAGVTSSCLLEHPPVVTSVSFYDGELKGLSSSLTHLARRSLAVGGFPASELSGRQGAATVVAVTVPSRSAQVVVSSPDPVRARQLAATVKLAATDANGCPARDADTQTLVAGGTPSRPGAFDAQIPLSPTSVVLCRYVGGLIEQSTSLSATQAAAFVKVVNSAPLGWSVADPQTYSPELCRRSQTTSSPAADSSSSDTEAYTVHARYAHGAPVRVLIRLGLCGDLGASNGSRSGERTTALAQQVVALVGNAEGWPGSVRPGRGWFGSPPSTASPGSSGPSGSSGS